MTQPMKYGALVVLAVVLLVGAIHDCAVIDQTPEQYIRTIRGYLHVPEAVVLETWRTDPDDDVALVRATLNYRKKTGDWMLVVNETWWEEATHSQRIVTLSHEMCHAAYDHDLLMPDLWYAVSKAEWEYRQARARVCAWDILDRMAR